MAETIRDPDEGDTGAVRRVAWVDGVPTSRLGELDRFAARGVHGPDFGAALTPAHEGQLFPIR